MPVQERDPWVTWQLQEGASQPKWQRPGALTPRFASTWSRKS